MKRCVAFINRKLDPLRSIPAALALLVSFVPSVEAAIFTVKPGTRFYSQPKASEKYLLDLPEVRVHVPPLRDALGFCQFKLVYKIVDRDNPALPATGWARCVSTMTNVDNLIPD